MDAEIEVQPSAESRPKARVCIPTWRHFSNTAAKSTLYEAQDVFASLDEVDLVALEPNATHDWKLSLLRRLLPRDFTRRLIHTNPGIKPMRLTQDYELFMVTCQQWYELLYLNAIDGWRDRCRTAICWLDEIYAGNIPSYTNWLHILEQFDHIVVPYKLTASALERTIGRPCHYLPRAVDVLRFSPHSGKPARVIDVLSIGRRWEGIHEKLLEWSKADEIFYVYDTVTDGGDQRVKSFEQHRAMLANMAKRSLFFMVAPGKMHGLSETHGQMEVGMRYFEGAAAGAVLLGEAPDTESFRALFNWPQAVIPVHQDGSNIQEVIRKLKGEPERIQAISEQNAARIASQHDWMHRWQVILDIASMKAMPKVSERAAHLKERAEAGQVSIKHLLKDESRPMSRSVLGECVDCAKIADVEES